MSKRPYTENSNEHSESADTENKSIENNSENDAAACKKSSSDDPGNLEKTKDATDNSCEVKEASNTIDKDEFLEPSPKRRCVVACEDPVSSEITELGIIDDNTTEIQTIEIEPENPEKLLNVLLNELESKIDELETNFSPKFKRTLADFLSHIVRWDPMWLMEVQRSNTTPPVVNTKRLTPILPTYRSFKHYYKIFEPLLTLEMWHAITDDYKMAKKRNFKPFSIVPNSFNNYVTGNGARMSNIDLDIVVSEDQLKQAAYPSHGDLLFIDYLSNRRDQNGFFRKTVFAYVIDLRKVYINKAPRYNRHLFATVKNPHSLITITVMTRRLDPRDVRIYSVNELQKVTYIQSNIRMVQGLQDLCFSPLMNMILDPKIEDYQLPPAKNVEEYHLVTKNVLNTKQLEAVMRVTEMVDQKIPKICLIQGPPGTGKSRVIVNLVMQIIHNNRRDNGFEKLSILVCAPSNSAIDSIVVQLLEIKQSMNEEGLYFSLVRTGRTDTMHPKAKQISLQKKADAEAQRAADGHRLGEIMGVKRIPFSRRVVIAKKNLIQSADVIASTLTSCYANDMEKAFVGRKNIICIVDEASQCTEPEALIPLMLGVKTLILVGDTNQLPATVLSQKAKRLGLDQSLFARIERVFKDTPNNPIIQLDVQYRMAVPVALFPNKYFYGGRLKNAAIMHKLPFHLYRVINLDSTQDSVKFSNSEEANFVANLIYTMIDHTNYGEADLPVTVGIITPYNEQKKMLTNKIINCIAPLKDETKKIDFEVNTVDSFQGQERDVIIMSCVRSNGIGFLSDRHRLCVALTRAKHSLIICGNFKTFENDPMWNALLIDAKSRGVYVNVKSNAVPKDIRRHIIR